MVQSNPFLDLGAWMFRDLDVQMLKCLDTWILGCLNAWMLVYLDAQMHMLTALSTAHCPIFSCFLTVVRCLAILKEYDIF